MYYIYEFCRTCLHYDKPLIDIVKKGNENGAFLINKLKLCVSEIDWSESGNVPMCQACIDKLNSAFEFKQLCLQSVETLENYTSQLAGLESSDECSNSGTAGKVYVSVNRSEVKQELVDEYVKIQKEEELKKSAAAFVKPNQQLYPQLSNIILTTNRPNNQNNNIQNAGFQNIFLNLIPSTAIKYPSSTNLAFVNKINNVNIKPPPTPMQPIKDANQNMFLNINNTLHKLLPIVTTTGGIHSNNNNNKEFKPIITLPTQAPVINNVKQPEELNISRILTESKTEELSVEVDPMCFEDSLEDDEDSATVDTSENDWDDLITSSKINSDGVTKNPTPTHLTSLLQSENKFQSALNNFIPIRPKVQEDVTTSTPTFQDKMIDFLNVDHFMVTKNDLEDDVQKPLMCEQCGQPCETIKKLHNHIKQLHEKFPYKCEHCSSVYAIKAQYESHMQKHSSLSDSFAKDTITLDDLSIENEALLFPRLTEPNILSPPPSNSDLAELLSDETGGTQFDYKCEACPRSFNSAHGLSRHKIRKHNEQQTRRKYFVKGMKNAKCEICNRAFSTQSYLQLHIKLHYRKNDYRLKVFNKEKYGQEKKDELDDNDEGSDGPAALDLPNAPIEVAVDETVVDVKREEEGDKQNKSEDKSSEGNIENNDSSLVSCSPPPRPLPSSDFKQTEGIKIKINLRNLKQLTPEKQEDRRKEAVNKNVVSAEEQNLRLDDGPVDIKMEVDAENSTISEQNESIDDSLERNENHCSSADLNDVVPLGTTSVPCNLHGELPSPTVNDSLEEAESLKDETSLDGYHSSMKIIVVDGKPQCPFCFKLFSRKHDLKRHVNNIHLKAIQYVCHLCNSQFYEAFHLTRHLRQHNSFVRCTGCMKDFSVLRDLKLHIIAIHENYAPCQCGTCGQTFPKIKYLREHMQEHDRTIIYKCHICNEEFRESRELSKHLVGHSGMYSCGSCQTTFTTEYELGNHIKCHNGDPTYEEKKYECEVCHNKFKKKRYLSAHMNNRHSIEKRNNVEIPVNRVVDMEYDSS